MNYRIAIVAGLALLAAALAAWWGWQLIAAAPALETTAIVEAPNGRAYQYIAAPGISWRAARLSAIRMSWHGRSGYLATIDDAAEYQFIVGQVFAHLYPDVTYLGGRQTAPGQWRWVTGPDGKADGGMGKLFWRGNEQGEMVKGLYANWMTPAFQHGGKWDVAKVCCVTLFSYGVPQFSTSLGTGEREEHVAGYIVEYGN